MRFKLQKIISVSVLAIVVMVALVPHTALASCSWWQWFVPGLNSACAGSLFFESFLSEFGEMLLRLMSVVLSIAGIILNMSIVFTLNIKTIFEATPAIEQTWIVIRNISSIFIIFALIYASIVTILGVKGPNFGSLVVKIFMAGILINFSLFFTKVLIDASNLVSLQFYKAIVPNAQDIDLRNTDKATAIKSVLSSSFYGGLSDVFQQSLKIPKIYNKKGSILSSAHASFLIIISTVGGSILMLTAALSFFVAGLAFIMRLVVLLLVIGFSPLIFVGMIFPKVDSNLTSEFKKYFLPQLTFMPAYLLLMYVALKFLSSGGFFDYLNDAQASITGTSNGEFILAEVGLIFQFLIALVFINLPLIAAIKLGAMTPKWANNIQHMAGGFAKRVGSAAGRTTLGNAGKYVGEKFDNMAAAAQGNRYGRGASSVLRTLGISQAVRGGISNVEKSKYGHQSLEDVEKEDKERKKEIRKVSSIRNLDTAIAAGNHAEIKQILSNMSTNEIANLKAKHLAHEHVVQHLSSGVYSSVDKGDKSDEDKVKIREARYEQLYKAASGGDDSKTRAIMNNMSGEDIQEYMEESMSKSRPVLDIPFMAHLKPSQLKKMEGVNKRDRQQIGDYITRWNYHTGLGEHPAKDYIRNNASMWS